MKKTLLLTTILAASLSAQDPLGQYANFVIQSPVQNIDTLQNTDKNFKVGIDYFYDSADSIDTHFINIPVQGLVFENIYLEATLPFKYASYNSNSESGLSDIMIGAAYSFGSMEAGSSRNVLGLRYNIDSGSDVIDAPAGSLDFYWDTMGKISDFTLRSGVLFNYMFGYDVANSVSIDGGFDSLLSVGLGHECLLTESLQTNAIISWYSSYGDSTVLGDIPGTNYDLVDLTLKWDTLKLNNRQISFGAKIPLYATDFNGQDYKSFTFFVNAAGLF